MHTLHGIKEQFPLLQNHPELIYLDNAATTQKPQAVIDAMVTFYTHHNAPISRGVYHIAEQATQYYEDARAVVAAFIGAQPEEIIFVKNATEGINLFAASCIAPSLQEGDRIVLTEYEHHANILPWQRLAQQQHAQLKYIPVQSDGKLAYDTVATIIDDKTKVVSFAAVSNVTGAYTDCASIINAAHAVGARVMIDAAQLVAHQPIDVKALAVDAMVFSGHKLFGPTGIGVLYVTKELMQHMIPYQVGGGVVTHVNAHEARYARPPYLFEAGTPPVAQAIGLAAAILWLQHYNMAAIEAHETMLIRTLIDGLHKIEGIKLIGPIDELQQRGHIVSFVVEGMHAHDVAAYLDEVHIAVRAGHHCAQPLATTLGIDASVRVSVACYNTKHDIYALLERLHTVRAFFLQHQ